MNTMKTDEMEVDSKDLKNIPKKQHNCSICDYSTSNRGNLNKHVESVHDNMTSCNCSINGHNFILRSDNNNSLKCTLKKKYIK